MPRWLFPVARVLLSLVFIVSGLEKIFSWPETDAYLVSRGIPAPGLLLVIATGIEMFGGALVALGHLTRPAALVLAAYLVPVTLLLHPVGLLQGMNEGPNPSDFLKNLAIMGGLLILAAVAPTPASIDAPPARKRREP
jgi:putative oxidoreductase